MPHPRHSGAQVAADDCRGRIQAHLGNPMGSMGWGGNPLPSPHTCEPHDMHGLSQGWLSSTALPRPTGQHGLSTARKTPVPSRLTGHSLYHYGIDSLHMGLHVSRSGGPELLVVIKVGPVGVRSRRGRALDFSCLGAAVTVQTWGWARRRRHGFMHAVSIYK